jgi:hypothetical protein
MNSCNNAYGGVCGGYEALCYEEGGELVYQNEIYPSCYYAVTVDIAENTGNEPFIYPNPANDYLIIDLSRENHSGDDYLLEISTVTGEKILRKTLAKSKNVIYLQEIKKGLYLINIHSNKKSFPGYKLIVD